jgi:hypothetical protein
MASSTSLETLCAALPFVLNEYRKYAADDHCSEVKKSDTITLGIWFFPWDWSITMGDEQVFARDVVNTEEFIRTVEEEESKRACRFVTLHRLERDTKVDSQGKIVYSFAHLTATFSNDGPCEDCGKYTKNGHMTCFCWTDEEDLARMDRDIALHR